MIPLIDADVLRYEIGFAAETGWKAIKEWKEGDPALDPPPFDYVASLLDGRIEEICRVVGATEKPRLFLTGKDNFREKIAKKTIYKGTRKGAKPWHYNNLTAYMIGKYDAEVIHGMEADDMLCIIQSNYNNAINRVKNTIICTRDKDLRQCPGWHYGWELGFQPQFGPELVDEIGYIKLKDQKEIKGVGSKFFYAQMIVGDKVDNIPGLPGKGPVFAYNLLVDTRTLEEMEKAVVEAYKGVYEGNWKEELMEQAQLLWMVRELDENGDPVMWRMMNEEY